MADSSDARGVLLNRLADEFAARHRAGGRPRLEEYCARHPELAGEIRELFPALAELERAKADAGAELAVEAAAAPAAAHLGALPPLRQGGARGSGGVDDAHQV